MMKAQLIRNIEKYGSPTIFLSKKRVAESYHELSEALPNVKLYYALKANKNKELIKQLDQLGCYFDVSSTLEIKCIERNNIAIEKCIHTHPIKTGKEITYAYNRGINTFVIDTEDQLYKIAQHAPGSRVFIRMAVHNKKALINLSKKFGHYTTAGVSDLIKKAHTLDFSSLGICFHTGSQNKNPLSFKHALRKSISLIKKLRKKGIPITSVDIGGGFPVSYTLDEPRNYMLKYCAVFYNELQELIGSGIEIIAEPGRYLAAGSMFLATSIIGKSDRKNKTWYYIDDNVYNTFSGVIYDHVQYPFYPLKQKEGRARPSVITGNTCDSNDIICKNVKIRPMEIGEILIFEKIGAYSTESASGFNGIPKAKIVLLEN